MAVMALSLGELAPARDWLANDVVPKVTTLAGVMPSRLKVRAERLAKRVTAGFTDAVSDLDDRWLNIAFSHQAIAALLPPADPDGSPNEFAGDADRFTDEGFKAGAAARSALLGDPTDPAAEGNPVNWRFGGPGNEADILLVFGADREKTMKGFVTELRESATTHGLSVLYEEHGGKLDRLGREHFGFQDGISQPGVRGRISDDPDTFLTPRTIDPDVVPEAWIYGQPGQYLLWPGAFVFGYETPAADPLLPGPPALPGPPWSRNGSYAVYRRLRQDVVGFREFAAEQAVALQQQGFSGMTGETLQANLFGRWPSGAPLARTPDGDDPDLGRDPLANNHFGFAADTPTLPLVGGGSTNTFPEAKADPVGLTCPLASHIRKVNTRDVGSDQGGRRASFQRRILRRALPFGPRLPESGPDPAGGDRGLMFLCYQASIVDQFEFLSNAWMGDPIAPRSPGGHDMVIGQNGQPGEQRERSCVILKPPQAGTVTATADAVIPTAAGYFFTPSLSALRDVLAATP
jgi:Dyp-type peroxidase family